MTTGHVEAEINVPFQYLSNFWRTLEFPLINCEVELQLTWSEDCLAGYKYNPGAAVGARNIALAAADTLKFQITDTKTYVPVVTLPSIESGKLLRQLERGFTKTVNWNKPLVTYGPVNANANLNIMTDPSFQGINRFFVLAYAEGDGRDNPRVFDMPTVEITDYNVMIDGKNFFDVPISDSFRKYTNLRDVMIGSGDDYTVGSLLDFKYFRDNYKIIAVDLSKQKVLDADPRAVQQINFKGNLPNNCRLLRIREESKDTELNFSEGTVKVM